MNGQPRGQVVSSRMKANQREPLELRCKMDEPTVAYRFGILTELSRVPLFHRVSRYILCYTIFQMMAFFVTAEMLVNSA